MEFVATYIVPVIVSMSQITYGETYHRTVWQDIQIYYLLES